MSFMQNLEALSASVTEKAQTVIGDVIYAYSGMETGQAVNEVVFYSLIVFTVYLSWLLAKPHDEVYELNASHN